MLRPVLSNECPGDDSKQADRKWAGKRESNLLLPLNRKAWRKFGRPLPDLHFGRHVHQEGQQNWRDQTHLHNKVQEGTQGDEIAFLPNYFLV